MENQHRQIQGYRELSVNEIDYMNQVKNMANSVGALIEEMKKSVPSPDPRWVAIAQTDLQKGFMSLVRSIAKPESF